VGALLGFQEGRQVHVIHSFELIMVKSTEVDSQLMFDEAYFLVKADQSL
jgi:hypothetical protein